MRLEARVNGMNLQKYSVENEIQNYYVYGYLLKDYYSIHDSNNNTGLLISDSISICHCGYKKYISSVAYLWL